MPLILSHKFTCLSSDSSRSGEEETRTLIEIQSSSVRYSSNNFCFFHSSRFASFFRCHIEYFNHIKMTKTRVIFCCVSRDSYDNVDSLHFGMFFFLPFLFLISLSSNQFFTRFGCKNDAKDFEKYYFLNHSFTFLSSLLCVVLQRNNNKIYT